MSKIKWNHTNEDEQIVIQIIERASKDELISKDRALNIKMDILACHLNGNPLDLKKLLNAHRFDFWGDIDGIQRYMDKETGKLTKKFIPICSL